MSDFDSNLQQLNDALLLEIVKAMALPQTNSAMAIISLLFGKATLRFSKLVLGLDREVEQHGAMEGARWLLQHFVKSHEANGMELIPGMCPSSLSRITQHRMMGWSSQPISRARI